MFFFSIWPSDFGGKNILSKLTASDGIKKTPPPLFGETVTIIYNSKFRVFSFFLFGFGFGTFHLFFNISGWNFGNSGFHWELFLLEVNLVRKRGQFHAWGKNETMASGLGGAVGYNLLWNFLMKN